MRVHSKKYIEIEKITLEENKTESEFQFVVENRIKQLSLNSKFVDWIIKNDEKNYIFKLKYFLLKLNIHCQRLTRPSKLKDVEIFNSVIEARESINFFKENESDITSVSLILFRL